MAVILSSLFFFKKKMNRKEKKKSRGSFGRAIYDSISFDTHDISLRAFHCQTEERRGEGGKSVRHFLALRNRVRVPSIYSSFRYIYIIFLFLSKPFL